MNVFMGNTAEKGSGDAAGDKEEEEPAGTAGTLTDLGANLSDELDIPLDLRWVNVCKNNYVSIFFHNLYG